MKATIIVPTYRRPKLLRLALQSAAAVDYPADDYQIVVVNDGGAGVDRDRVRRWWQGPQAQLRYARIKHAGLSAAINRGLQLAKGDYCTILADDDLILRNKLRVLGGFLDAHLEADVVYSLARYVNDAGRAVATPPKMRRFLRAHPVLTWQHIEQRHGLWVHGTSTMYRTQVCRDVGGWDTQLNTGEEYEFHLRLLHAGHDFHAVDAVTTGYRVHAGSKSNHLRNDRRKMRRHIARKLGYDSRAPVSS